MQAKEIEAYISELTAPLCERFRVQLEDVEYVKEGADYFLRVYLDKEGGVNIDDCENVSRALSDLLDQNDPIKTQYYLEVSSPGLDRRLYKPKHFEKYMGRKVDVKFFKAKDGQKKITGVLQAYENGVVTVEAEGTGFVFPLGDAAYIRLFVEIS